MKIVFNEEEKNALKAVDYLFPKILAHSVYTFLLVCAGLYITEPMFELGISPIVNVIGEMVSIFLVLEGAMSLWRKIRFQGGAKERVLKEQGTTQTSNSRLDPSSMP